MAGSFNHVINRNAGDVYMGTDLLENMGDMKEAVNEMAFMLLFAQRLGIDLDSLSNEYFKCLRGEQPWPDFMRPGIER